jgi:hypothetical protein
VSAFFEFREKHHVLCSVTPESRFHSIATIVPLLSGPRLAKPSFPQCSFRENCLFPTYVARDHVRHPRAKLTRISLLVIRTKSRTKFLHDLQTRSTSPSSPCRTSSHSAAPQTTFHRLNPPNREPQPPNPGPKTPNPGPPASPSRKSRWCAAVPLRWSGPGSGCCRSAPPAH